MYLDFLVDIPISTGKITYRKKGDTDYVYYEYKRIYTKGSNITNPKRVTIGKRDKTDLSMMIPNENYLKYFQDEELPEINERTKRSSCLRIGTWLVIRKIMEEYRFTEILEKYICKKDLGLVLDLAAYSIISENNAEQYYPDYAYNHPLFSNDMHIYSDSKVSDVLQSKEPLFYEEYSGSINDVSQLEFMIGKAAGYGYKKIGFILDRGYFSRGNINCMDKYGYHFVIMVKGMNKLVISLILEVTGSFENKWVQHIDDYDVYGTTIQRKLIEFLALIVRNRMYNCLKDEILKFINAGQKNEDN